MTTRRKCFSAMSKKKVHIKMADIYHEKQVKELCALHALNNLFQSKVYDKSELDGICENLAPNAWFNPHKSMLGLGNYDVNVILLALQSRGFEGIWFDKRNRLLGPGQNEGASSSKSLPSPSKKKFNAGQHSQPRNLPTVEPADSNAKEKLYSLRDFCELWDPQSINLTNIVGFILNTPSDYKFCIVTIRLHRRHWVAIREIDGQYYNLDSKNDVPQVLGDAQKLIDFLRTELKNNDRELFIVVTQDVEKNQAWLLEPPASGTSETRT